MALPVGQLPWAAAGSAANAPASSRVARSDRRISLRACMDIPWLCSVTRLATGESRIVFLHLPQVIAIADPAPQVVVMQAGQGFPVQGDAQAGTGGHAHAAFLEADAAAGDDLFILPWVVRVAGIGQLRHA